MENAPPRTPNRLAREKSPYLLQHARNPVDWYPWGDEAFERAAREDRPIFLSIGYSTCHWCHVMERESFEDEAVAAALDDGFVAIKVDREERPDIDAVYMAVCQALTGGGGWPLTILMTPDRRPFFAGTYLPKETRFGRVGIIELLDRVRRIWTDRRDEVLSSSERIVSVLREVVGPAKGETVLDESHIERARAALGRRFDAELGGFGEAPKFPSPHLLWLLLRDARRTGRKGSVEMVERTLEAMRQGGLFDQVGFGFHRYSTDRRWLVPHFEKMLYDQATLLLGYTEGHLATGRVELGRTARQIAEYVLRDLRAAGGGFYSGEDADSEGEEGRFYVWTLAEVRELLGAEEAELYARAFGLREGGNFVEEATGESTGACIPHVARSVPDLAAELGSDPASVEARLEASRLALLARRSTRVRPGLDDKVLADWNGLMIAALARAGAALSEPALVRAAEEAAAFVDREMVSSEGRLLHRYRDGEAGILGFLDDYAMQAWGRIELYAATLDAAHLRRAVELADRAVSLFWDERAGAFFLTAHDAEEVLARPKESYDGAMPSGNSVAASVLVRLSHLTGRPDLADRAARLFRALGAQVSRAPEGHAHMLTALALALGPSHQVVVAGRAGAPETEALLAVLRGRFLPEVSVLFRPTDEPLPEVVELAPFTGPLTSEGQSAMAYVCHGGSCDLPTADPDTLLAAIDAAG